MPPPVAPAAFVSTVEFTPGFRPRPGVSHVLFDFDGTLSLIREGWPEVMLPMFEEMLPRRADEAATEVRQLLYDDIMRLNGKQTIYQMMQFASRVRALVAMGVLSARVLLAMPFALAAILTVINRGYMEPLYTTTTGHVLIVIALVMMSAGALVLRRLVRPRAIA